MFPLRQVVPRQRVLMPRQPAPLPKQSTLTPRELVLLFLGSLASRWASSANKSQRSSRGNSLEDPNPKWVINLSSKPLTQAQRSLLVKGPNFVVNPRHPPNLEYTNAIELVYTKLGQQYAEELRAEISRVLRSSHPPNLTLTKAQSQAIRELKKGQGPHSLNSRQGGGNAYNG